MPPPEWGRPVKRNSSRLNDWLQLLELVFGSFGDSGLNAILTKCKALSHLDIQGCWGVELKDDLEDRCLQLRYFKSPWIDDYVNESDADDDEEFANLLLRIQNLISLDFILHRLQIFADTEPKVSVSKA
ncbi:hypothetical protein P3X46_017386 [Hevea brasiliensis]|uniref:Uncharacterized protein n=1 Tax=Hevea brasiliensis TaxID=3981 RepID=A0ABQ9M2B7_HEVBR|nr:hypothetical protein P3X46_017386 [Hevea brasiliensis]